jgi:hypothetical protein
MGRRVICVTEVERALFVSHFLEARDKARVIANGIDLGKLLVAVLFPTDTKTIVNDLHDICFSRIRHRFVPVRKVPWGTAIT